MKELLLDLLFAVITAAVPVLTGYAVSYIGKAREKLEAETGNAILQGYIKEISDAVTDAVAATSQTYVDTLKKQGKFTKEAQEEAARKALDACIASIAPETAELITEVYGDLTEYLTTKIEAEVRKQKEAAGTPLTAVLESTTDTTAVAASTAAATAATIAQTAISQISAEATQAEQA